MPNRSQTIDDIKGEVKLEDCKEWCASRRPENRQSADPDSLRRNFDGSSTNQAQGHDSDIYLRPVAVYKDPFRRGKCVRLFRSRWSLAHLASQERPRLG